MKNVLIVFSGKAQAGKSTCSNLLKEIIDEKRKAELVEKEGKAYTNYWSDVYIHSFAKALKDIATEYFGWSLDKGLYYEIKVDGVWKKTEDIPSGTPVEFRVIPDKGRQLLINIGQAFRAIRPTIWVDYVINKIKSHAKEREGQVYLIDDMRFKNELALAKTFDKCISIRVSRPSSLSIDDISENDLDDAEFDHYIENNGNMTMLKGTLSVLWEKIEKDL